MRWLRRSISSSTLPQLKVNSHCSPPHHLSHSHYNLLARLLCHDFYLGLSPPIPPNPSLQNSPTPPCPSPTPRHCLSALMLIITTEWIRRFPWMSVEPLACSVAPLLLILSCFPSLPFHFSMGIKRVRRRMERLREGACPDWGCFAMQLPHLCHLANQGCHNEWTRNSAFYDFLEVHNLDVTINLPSVYW